MLQLTRLKRDAVIDHRGFLGINELPMVAGCMAHEPLTNAAGPEHMKVVRGVMILNLSNFSLKTLLTQSMVNTLSLTRPLPD